MYLATSNGPLLRDSIQSPSALIAYLGKKGMNI